MQAKKWACFKIRGAVDDKGQLGWLCSTSFLEAGGSGLWPAEHRGGVSVSAALPRESIAASRLVSLVSRCKLGWCAHWSRAGPTDHPSFKTTDCSPILSVDSGA